MTPKQVENMIGFPIPSHRPPTLYQKQGISLSVIPVLGHLADSLPPD